ncbi:carboxy-S-adenosyl-L-methionine synthase CmoA [Salinibius halmophilus]|uniref:carboxy-S-adenosyl-L-methionine synthase CmoA n=1 Tax=Salinibius halmophilus TaxID=1853216 RepID=UPI000E666944|nr:carboxy-S-adenosyl-L-methionine synthase CmoA [Salinibius halmophilus]
MKDDIFAHPQANIGKFEFDETVAHVFPDMIKRSVPGYSHVIALTGVLAGQYAKPDSKIYDLGCSLGASTLAMRHHVKAPNCEIIGIDTSDAMLRRARDWIDSTDEEAVTVTLEQNDIRNVDFQPMSVAVLNYTLQFVPMADRTALLQKIYDAMLPGAALILSEKVTFTDAAQQDLLERHQLDFKRANGYSELEISQKRQSIEDVLVTETLPEHHQRLRDVGFSQVETWFQCFNFTSMIAIK